ncbi:MAG TPA: four helix bundle protein [Polyangiaceae bacterium]|nr:four helix bundle protein [Polyangiaceae bacterium]
MAESQPGYEALPIYKIAMATAIAIEMVVRAFPRSHKYTFGARLRDTSMDTVILVGRAYRRGPERAPVVAELVDRIEELKLLINLGREIQAFASFKQYAQLMEQVMNMARQAEGWRKASVRPRSTAPA